jgi:hypothetical protein
MTVGRADWKTATLTTTDLTGLKLAGQLTSDTTRVLRESCAVSGMKPVEGVTDEDLHNGCRLE